MNFAIWVYQRFTFLCFPVVCYRPSLPSQRPKHCYHCIRASKATLRNMGKRPPESTCNSQPGEKRARNCMHILWDMKFFNTEKLIWSTKMPGRHARKFRKLENDPFVSRVNLWSFHGFVVWSILILERSIVSCVVTSNHSTLVRCVKTDTTDWIL